MAKAGSYVTQNLSLQADINSFLQRQLSIQSVRSLTDFMRIVREAKTGKLEL